MSPPCGWNAACVTSPPPRPSAGIAPLAPPIHNGIHQFIFENRLASPPPPSQHAHGFCQHGLLTPAELADMTVEFATSVALPRGSAELGYSDPAMPFSGARGKPTAEGTGSDDDDDPAVTMTRKPAMTMTMTMTMTAIGWMKVRTPPPTTLVEIGLPETYEYLLHVCRDYLVSSGGRVRLAILIHAEPTQSTTSNTTTPTTITSRNRTLTPPTPSDRGITLSSPPTSPGSDHYDTLAREIASLPAPPLDVLLELWEAVPWAGCTAGRSGGCPQIQQRGERIHILRNGKIPCRPPAPAPAASSSHRKRKRKPNANRQSRLGDRTLGVPFRIEDFGLQPQQPSTAAQAQSNNPIPSPLVMVDWTPYAVILKHASYRTALERRISGRKRQRAAVRVSRGDFGGEWTPREEDDKEE
ncbi:hypothetical protein DFH27DRAFT_616959 [Peziza echinospora]|nr:hypothetical protein DFH27DRAFT_616959 [Peziza echinospora]